MSFDDRERFDPLRFVGRPTAAVLALAGLALVLLPSAQFGWDPIKGGWAIRPTLWLADAAALIGCALALATVAAREAHRTAPLIGAAFGAAAVAWGLQSADAVRGAEGAVATALGVARLEAWLLAAALFSAFCTRFPRLLTAADHLAMSRRVAAGQVGSGLAVRDDPFAAMDSPFAAWDRFTARVFGAASKARLQALAQRLGLVHTGRDDEPAWARRLNARLEPWLFRDAWVVVVALMPVAAAFALSPWPKAASLVFSVTGTLGMVSCFALRFMLINVEPDARRRVLWIAAGVVAAFAATQLGFWAFIAGGLSGHVQLGLGTFILTVPLAALLLVLGFAMAVFGSGALDPRLAIKRSIVTGIVAATLTFLFALVESLVATWLAGLLGLPANAAPVVASAAVAVALGPMWKRTSAWVGGRFGRTATEPAAG